MLAEDGGLVRSGRWDDLLAVIEWQGGRPLTSVWRNQGALTVTTVLETFLTDPHAFPQCLLARCLPQREHDRQPCARRCRRTDECNDGVARGVCQGLIVLGPCRDWCA